MRCSESMQRPKSFYSSLEEGVGNDPMEEAFGNMQHPMELMLLGRECILYVAKNRVVNNKEGDEEPNNNRTQR